MDINYFSKNPHTEASIVFDQLDSLKITHPSVLSISHLDVDIDLDWNNNLFVLTVKGVINFSLNVIDEYFNKSSTYSDSIEWNEEYCFSEEVNSLSNVINDKVFEIGIYAVEQININLPYNLINNSDIIKKECLKSELLSQEEYMNHQQNKLDPRWEKLDELKNKK